MMMYSKQTLIVYSHIERRMYFIISSLQDDGLNAKSLLDLVSASLGCRLILESTKRIDL
jgi:hypothetical protein